MGPTHLTDAADAFAERMGKALVPGQEFESVAEGVLPKVVGEAAANLLLSMLGERGRTDPRLFALAMQKMFGDAGAGLLEPMVEFALRGAGPMKSNPVSELESYLARTHTPGGKAQPNLTPPKSHRFYDEQGRLRDSDEYD